MIEFANISPLPTTGAFCMHMIQKVKVIGTWRGPVLGGSRCDIFACALARFGTHLTVKISVVQDKNLFNGQSNFGLYRREDDM